jgi:hypothetical protein
MLAVNDLSRSAPSDQYIKTALPTIVAPRA